MSFVAISLGTNKGDRARYMESMQTGIGEILQTPPVFSPLMETEPVDVDENQQWFYNRIVCGEYYKTPEELLDRCLSLERSLERQRPYRYAPRTADVDILFFGEIVVQSRRLTIPHPALFKRRFCIEGLARIIPDFRVTGHKRTFGEELKHMSEEVAGQRVYFH